MKWKDYLDLSNSESPFVGRADEDGARPQSLRRDYEEVR
jgi:hypothetical protein